MSVSRSCFDNVFGLSRTGCDCFTQAMPTDASTSHSGLYLDETPGMSLEKVFDGQDCENTGWDIMGKAYDEGINGFNARVLSLIRQDTKWRRQPVRSQIGDTKNSSSTVNLGYAYHGMELMLADHVGGKATIKRIGGFFKFNGSVDVSVYGEDDDSPLYTYTITATMNKLTWTEIEPLELDMTASGAQNKRYWFLFEPSGGQQALNSRIHCGCAGKPSWNGSHPWFESAIGMDGMAWSAWSMSMGTFGTTLSDRANWTHTNETQGLVLDVDFKCDARTVLCSGEPDYQGDPVQQAYAWGARFEAALYLVDWATGSTKVNRETIAGGDELQLAKAGYLAKVKEFSEYIAGMLTVDADDDNLRSGVNTYSDCFTCRDQVGMKIRTIQT